MSNQAVFYWELSERDRAQLSREDVERYVDAELMTKGVLKARRPMLEVEPNVAAQREPRFTVKGDGGYPSPVLLFRSEEAAAAFLKLDIEYRDTYYADGSHIEHGKKFKSAIDTTQIVPAHVYEANKSALQSLTAIRAANEKATNAYQEALRKQDLVLKDLWDDWTAQRAKDRKFREVMATFEDYRQIAASDLVALRFLRKVHSSAEIEEAAAWCGVTLPIIDAEFAEVDPAPTLAQESEATAMAVF